MALTKIPIGLIASGESFETITTNNATFPDNGKAIFGAGSDLQIYHDGFNSYVKENGTGNLWFTSNGTTVGFGNNDLSEIYAVFNNDGEAKLFFNNSQKLTTTSTGIDVTGTATMDGLTVDSGTASPITNLKRSGIHSGITFSQTISNLSGLGADLSTYSLNADTGYVWQTGDSGGVTAPAFLIAPNRDISFYEDTGTTPKFFWDSSAESLGIGTDSPDGQLHVKGTTNKTLKLDPTFSSGTYTTLAFARNGTDKWRVFHPSDDSYLSFYNDQSSVHQLTLKSDGRVGIGTTSPQMGLQVGPGSQAIAALPGIGIANGSSTYSFYSASDGTKQYIAGIDHNITSTKSGSLSNHDHGIVTNNTNRIYIKNTGNVGIGTDSPTSKLEISGFSSGAGLKLNYGNSNGTIEAINFIANGGANGVIGMQMVSAGVGDLWLGGSGGRALTLYRNRNVGINETAPFGKLHISDTQTGRTAADSVGNLLVLEDNENGMSILSSDSGVGYILFGDAASSSSGGIAYDHSANKFNFRTNEAWNRMIINASGNVGIGLDPSAWAVSSNALQVGVYAGLSRNDALGAGDLSYNAYLTTSASDSWSRIIANASTRIHQRDGSIQFKYGASGAAGGAITWSESMRIDASGNVGIGGTQGQSKLFVDNGAGTRLFIGLSNNIYADAYAHIWRSPSAATERMRIDASGNLLVGKTSTSYAVEGIALRSDNAGIQSTVTNESCFIANRLGSDGRLMLFAKDTTTVGSIFNSGTTMGVGSLATGVLLANNIDAILPWNASTNAERGSAIDLGRATTGQFKNLYLSGKTYLTTSSGAQLVLQTDATRGFVGTSTSHALVFETAGIERMRIDASGNVKIGDSVTDITSKLTVSGNGDANVATFMYDGSAGTYLDIDLGGANGEVTLAADARTGSYPPMTFKTSATERLRIAADGKVIVGGTTQAEATSVSLNPEGYILAKSSHQPAAFFDRDNSDGEIITLRRDGAAVGSIGTANGDSVIIGNSTGNLILYAGTVAPASTSAGGASNGAVDLGASGRHFKDLYLSGGALTSTVKFLTNTTVSGSDATIFRPADNTMAFSTNGAERLRIDEFGGLIIKSVGGAQAAGFHGGNLVNGITAVPSAAGTPFVLGRDTGTLRSAHFGGNLRFDSGYGVEFSVAGGTGTSTSGTLDDYEEGTWTPHIYQGETQMTSPTVVTGRYVKVGKTITLGIYFFKNSGAPSVSGEWQVRNLPFAAEAGNTNFVVAGYMSVNSTQSNIPARWQANSSSALSLYGQFTSTSWTTGYIEFSFSGTLEADD